MTEPLDLNGVIGTLVDSIYKASVEEIAAEEDTIEDVSQNDLVMEYVPMRSSRGSSTVQGISSGQIQYLNFLHSLKTKNLKYQSWTEYPVFRRKLSDVCASHAISSRKKPFKLWTALQYMSAAVDAVTKRFPDDKVSIDKTNWYPELRLNMIKYNTLRHIAAGESVKVVCCICACNNFGI